MAPESHPPQHPPLSIPPSAYPLHIAPLPPHVRAGSGDEARSTCLYDLVLPPGPDGSQAPPTDAGPLRPPPPRPGPAAKEYPFPLDAFQVRGASAAGGVRRGSIAP